MSDNLLTSRELRDLIKVQKKKDREYAKASIQRIADLNKQLKDAKGRERSELKHKEQMDNERIEADRAPRRRWGR